jgi:integrase
MVGRGFRKTRTARDPIHCPSARWPLQDGASQKPVPLDPELAGVLLMWRRQSAYPMDGDWVFASPASKGKLPYWSFSIFRVYIRPALKTAKIAGKVGWHIFRHSFATILKSHGEDVKTGQELLRHANSSVTMNLYAQALTTSSATRRAKWPGWSSSLKRIRRKSEILIGAFRTGEHLRECR